MATHPHSAVAAACQEKEDNTTPKLPLSNTIPDYDWNSLELVFVRMPSDG